MTTYTAFLRVRHPSIDPGEITRELGLAPAHAWAAGSPRGAGAERGAHTESYWFAPLGESIWPRAAAAGTLAGSAGQAMSTALQAALPLEAFLLAQIRQLTPHRSFFARLSTEGGRCELAVTLGAHDRWSIELPSSLLRSLAALDISITLEVNTGDEPLPH